MKSAQNQEWHPICLFKQALYSHSCSERLYPAEKIFKNILLHIITNHLGMTSDCYGKKITADTYLFTYEMIEYIGKANSDVSQFILHYWCASHECCLDLDFADESCISEEDIMESFAAKVLYLTVDLFHYAVKLPCGVPRHLLNVT